MRTLYLNSGNREMWETSMKGLQSLVRRTTPSSFAYICEKTGNSLKDKVIECNKLVARTRNRCFFDSLMMIAFLHEHMQMDELACFAPGMIALGASGSGPDDSQKFLSLAEEVLFNSV